MQLNINNTQHALLLLNCNSGYVLCLPWQVLCRQQVHLSFQSKKKMLVSWCR